MCRISVTIADELTEEQSHAEEVGSVQKRGLGVGGERRVMMRPEAGGVRIE